MPEPNDATLVYANHAPQDLPAWCRDLFDPGRALPPEVLLIRRAYLSNAIVLVVTAIPAAFALIMTLLDLMHGKLVLKEWLALFPVFTLPLAGSIAAAYRERRLKSEIAAGRLRMGLFLSPTALLLRMKPDACSMVPRQWIVGFETTVLNGGRAGNGSTYRMHLIYRVNQNGFSKKHRISFDCPQLEGYFQEHEALLRLLQKWLADGIVPCPAPGSGTTPAATAGKRRPGPLTPDEISKAKKTAWQAEQKMRLEQEQKIEAARPKPRKRPPVFLPDGSLKIQWEHHTPGEHHYFCGLNAREVVAWENWRNYAPSEMGGAVSFEQFLAGEYQDMLQAHFGRNMLEEVIAAVEYLKANPGEGMQKHKSL